VDPAHYDRIRADDRLSLLDLRSLAAHKPVECGIDHSDGSTETLWLEHSFTDSQLQWFYAGSALNCLRDSVRPSTT
jgi:aconitate hydratase